MTIYCFGAWPCNADEYSQEELFKVACMGNDERIKLAAMEKQDRKIYINGYLTDPEADDES